MEMHNQHCGSVATDALVLKQQVISIHNADSLSFEEWYKMQIQVMFLKLNLAN